MFQTFTREGWVHSALKPVTCIRINLQRTTRIGNLHRVPISRLNEDIDRFVRTSRVSSPHDARNALRTRVIADHHLTGGKLIGFLIQRRNFFATKGTMHP